MPEQRCASFLLDGSAMRMTKRERERETTILNDYFGGSVERNKKSTERKERKKYKKIIPA